MRSGRTLVWTIGLLTAGFLAAASADTTQRPLDESWQMLDSWLNKVLASVPIKVKPQKVARIEDSGVRTLFPGSDFYGVSFATWPIAPRLPKELSYDTLVRVHDGQSVESIRDPDSLRAFLAHALTEIRDEKQAEAAGLAALRLAETVAKARSFATPNVSVSRKADTLVADARSAASDPEGGDVTVHLEFTADGKPKPEAIVVEDRTRRAPPG